MLCQVEFGLVINMALESEWPTPTIYMHLVNINSFTSFVLVSRIRHM